MPGRDFVQWCRGSALGHVALYEVLGLVPVSEIFIALKYKDGTHTFPWALYIVFLTACSLVVAALLSWFTITKPRRRP
jgi:hypothetical protein